MHLPHGSLNPQSEKITFDYIFETNYIDNSKFIRHAPWYIILVSTGQENIELFEKDNPLNWLLLMSAQTN